VLLFGLDIRLRIALIVVCCEHGNAFSCLNISTFYRISVSQGLRSIIILYCYIRWRLVEHIPRLGRAHTHIHSSHWLIMMGWDWRLRTAAITGLLFIPRVNVRGEPWLWWWWWCRLGITPDLSTRARWQSYQQRHLERVGGMDEGMRMLRIQYLWYVNESFTCRKILRHGTSGFIPIRRKVCCGFLSPLKIHSLCRVWIRDPWVQWQAYKPLHH
jgi:hypothetical protein